jgi:dTDP-4-dehydrorhamnose 3,5-epimerase
MAVIMNVIQTAIPDVFIFEPKVFGDDRGFFFESFNHQQFEAAIGRSVNFVQDNHSKSSKGVLRGLHYQLAPHAQGKLVRCVAGEVFDVAVDIRKSSPTFGQWVGVHPGEQAPAVDPGRFRPRLYDPERPAEFLYKTTNYYAPESDRGIRWNDETIGITWPKSTARSSPPPKTALPNPSLTQSTSESHAHSDAGRFLMHRAHMTFYTGSAGILARKAQRADAGPPVTRL